MSPPRLHVGPDADSALVEAARRAEAELVAPEDAEAFVWVGGPDALPPVLHPGVRWVQLPNAGVEKWLDAGIIDRERTWTSAAGVYAHTVAEHALGLMLAGARKLPDAVRATSWRTAELNGHTLEGLRVAIVGAGGIGRSLIRMLEPFGTEVIAITRSGREVEGATESLPADRLAEVWPRADVVVVAAPATEATRHLLGEDELRALPSGAWIVNVARGSLIDTDALVRVLREGAIAGAALDVTDPEPLPDGHPLWSEPRALITPHTANPPQALIRRLAGRVEENVRRFAAGEELLGVIDLDRDY